MSARIDQELLNAYELSGGDPERLPKGHGLDMDLWELLDALLLDLHLIRYGYAGEEHARLVDRQLAELCEDRGIVDRIKAMRT